MSHVVLAASLVRIEMYVLVVLVCLVCNQWRFCCFLTAAESQDHEVLHELHNVPSNNLGCEPGAKMAHTEAKATQCDCMASLYVGATASERR